MSEILMAVRKSTISQGMPEQWKGKIIAGKTVYCY